MKRYCCIILVFVVFVSMSMNFVWPQEGITITTYYPSPMGIYETIEVTGSADVESAMILSETATLTNNQGTEISADGSLESMNLNFNGERYFAATLHARDLNVTGDFSGWDIPFFEVDGSYTFGSPNCPNGFVNSIRNTSGVMPLCFVIPIPPSFSVALVLCTGWEIFAMDYKCIRKK